MKDTQIKKLIEEGNTYQDVANLLGISRQRAHQLANPVKSPYDRVNVRLATKQAIANLAKERGMSMLDFMDYVAQYFAEECTCRENDDVLCPVCKKYLEQKEIE
jgi:predicted transcriptional regulator